MPRYSLVSILAGLALVGLSQTATAQTTAPQTVKGTGFALTDGPRADPALQQAIMKADAALFDAVFITCDADALAPQLTDDVRFIHDKWGVIATSKAQLVEAVRQSCARQAAGQDFKARRELVGEAEIYPLNGYGAVEIGVHRFFARVPGKPDQETEEGRFMILWKQVDGVWKMAETVSYDHRLAQ